MTRIPLGGMPILSGNSRQSWASLGISSSLARLALGGLFGLNLQADRASPRNLAALRSRNISQPAKHCSVVQSRLIWPHISGPLGLRLLYQKKGPLLKCLKRKGNLHFVNLSCFDCSGGRLLLFTFSRDRPAETQGRRTGPLRIAGVVLLARLDSGGARLPLKSQG